MKIVSSYKFEGNIVQRNIFRKKSIEELLTNHDLQNIFDKVKVEYKNKNYIKLKSIILNELFFEELEDKVFYEYIQKLYSCKNEIDIEKFMEIYKKYANRGFIYTMDKFIKSLI